MKILQFICPTGFYGAERWVLALGKHLKDLDNITCDLAVTRESEDQNLRLVEEYQKSAGTTYLIPMSGRFDLSVIAKLVELIKTEGYDIIHTHGYKSDILGVWAARKAGIKCVVTPHGFENTHDIKLRLFIWLGCQAMRFGNVVAPLSKQLCEDVKKYGIKGEKLQYIQNGVDLMEVEAQRALTPSLQKPSGEKWIGFIGQMISRKNIDDILEIFDALSQKHSGLKLELKLKLLGDGESRAGLEQKAQSLKSASNIEFLGFRDDRLDYLQSFDLFVMTSTLEGIPRCLMETMAMGIPVAAYDIAGIDQLLEHNNTGMLATLHDKHSLQAHWEALLFDAEKAKQITENARQFVLENYSAQRMADEYVALFSELLHS